MSLQDFFTKYPLYEVIYPANGDDKVLNILDSFTILYKSSTFDMFCIECGTHSVFKREEEPYYGGYRVTNKGRIPEIQNGEYLISAKCSRDDTHKVTIIIYNDNLNLQKIGQHPSLADILSPDLKRYKAAIGTDRVQEWSRAIGLSSHGIGAGAFVYLRRVLESLVEEAHNEAKGSDDWDDTAYIKARFAEKISMLSHYLPSFIVENKNTYSILSKGVHELSEQTCLEYFPILNAAIELISEEKLAKIQVDKRKNEIRNAMANISSEINS